MAHILPEDDSPSNRVAPQRRRSKDRVEISDKGDLRKYRTELPNLIDDLGLSVSAYRLYGHLKRVAGNSGICFQSTRKLAAHCRMSIGQVSAAKRELARLELIERKQSQERKTEEIAIVDIWDENFSQYSARNEKPQRGVHLLNTSSLPERVHQANEDVQVMNANVHSVNALPYEERTLEELTSEEAELGNLRWILEESDDGGYRNKDVTDAFHTATGRTADEADAELIGSQFRFSSMAIASLLPRLHEHRPAGKSLAYFGRVLKDITARCDRALKENTHLWVGCQSAETRRWKLRKILCAVETWFLQDQMSTPQATSLKPPSRHGELSI